MGRSVCNGNTKAYYYMKILVTGATGFIGNHVIKQLLEKGVHVIATGRSKEKARNFLWFERVEFIEFDISKTTDQDDLFSYFNSPDLLIHLAWEGLPNYYEMFHLEINLFHQYSFLKNLIKSGLKNVTITGTCLEYGLQNGPLHESLDSQPQNPYAIAKDSLRKFIETLNNHYAFSFKWVRLFYMYGEGQSKNSILPLLQKAIDANEDEFKMSGGEQLRDYLSIERVAEIIIAIAIQDGILGIVNCCSGIPISVRRLVEDYIKKLNSPIKLALGHFPYPAYEAMAFWGDPAKLKKIISSK